MKLIMESWRGYQNFDLEDILEEIDVLVEEYKEVLEKEHILSERKVTLIKESIVQKIAQLAKSAFSRVASMASSGAEKVDTFKDISNSVFIALFRALSSLTRAKAPILSSSSLLLSSVQ